MPKSYTLDEVRETLRRKTEHAGSLRAYARLTNVSAAYISDVLRGHREPGEKILQPLGFVMERETFTTYRRVK